VAEGLARAVARRMYAAVAIEPANNRRRAPGVGNRGTPTRTLDMMSNLFSSDQRKGYGVLLVHGWLQLAHNESDPAHTC
jgi:hypothetical protein